MSTTVTYKGETIATVSNQDKTLTTQGKYLEDNILLRDSTPSVADKAQSIPFGVVDGTSTSTAFTATVDGITELEDGTCMLLKNGVVTSAAGFTININGLGAKPVYSNMAAATAESTTFNINYTILFIYDSTRVAGGCWIYYRGYYSDSNSVGYQLRTNSTLREAADKGYRYRLWFQTLDGKWSPANKSSSTNATASRTPNTREIDPFGEIIYYSTNGTTEANANLAATTCWTQYVLALGYSFNTTGAALTLTNPAPVYLKCTPKTNGSVTIDGYVQTLPSTADSKVYIYLGMAYSATNIELTPHHPVYYHDGTGIRRWNGVKIPTKVSELTNDSGFITSYTETDPVFLASPAATITSADITTWNAAVQPNDIYIDGNNILVFS